MWERRLRKLDRLGVRGAVLDVGAGIGEFLHYANGRFSTRVGTEVSREAIEDARQRHGLDLVEGEFESLEFDAAFDLVTLFHVLEHVPDPRSTLECARQALLPGGWLVIAVPNDLGAAKLKIKGLLARLRIRGHPAIGPLGLPALTLDERQQEVHLSHFSPKVLVMLLRSLGFVDVRDSLDPYYAETGGRKLQHDLRYAAGSAIKRVLGVNVYDTIWIEARRPPLHPA